MKVDERWFSWATAVAAVLAVLVLMAQAFLNHQGRERAAAADIRRDLADLAQAAATLERRLESGLRHYEAVVCGRTEVEVALTDGRDGKHALRGEVRMRADLAALGTATSRASVDEALDGVAFASERLTGELSLLHAASEWLEPHVQEMFQVGSPARSGGSPPEQSGGKPEAHRASQANPGGVGAPGPDGQTAAGPVEHECEPPLDRSLAGGEEAKAIIDFLQAAARDLAAYPYCELVALAEADAAGPEGWTALGRLVEQIDKDRAEAAEGESGERGKLKDLFDDIGSGRTVDRQEWTHD